MRGSKFAFIIKRFEHIYFHGLDLIFKLQGRIVLLFAGPMGVTGAMGAWDGFSQHKASYFGVLPRLHWLLWKQSPTFEQAVHSTDGPHLGPANDCRSFKYISLQVPPNDSSAQVNS